MGTSLRLPNVYTHPNHSGDVTSAGDGATTIASNAVSLAKMADMATASLLGRDTAATGDPEVLSKATALSLLNVEDGADVTDATNVAAAGAPLLSSDNIFTGTNLNTAQPMVLAFNSVIDSDVTGDGTDVTVEFNSEVFDQDSNFNITTDTFTAPVTGKYLIEASVLIQDITGSHTLAQFKIVTSNNTFRTQQLSVANLADSTASATLGGGVIANMDANDTLTIVIRVSNGAKVIDIASVISVTFVSIGLLA